MDPVGVDGRPRRRVRRAPREAPGGHDGAGGDGAGGEAPSQVVGGVGPAVPDPRSDLQGREPFPGQPSPLVPCDDAERVLRVGPALGGQRQPAGRLPAVMLTVNPQRRGGADEVPVLAVVGAPVVLVPLRGIGIVPRRRAVADLDGDQTAIIDLCGPRDVDLGLRLRLQSQSRPPFKRRGGGGGVNVSWSVLRFWLHGSPHPTAPTAGRQGEFSE